MIVGLRNSIQFLSGFLSEVLTDELSVKSASRRSRASLNVRFTFGGETKTISSLFVLKRRVFIRFEMTSPPSPPSENWTISSETHSYIKKRPEPSRTLLEALNVRIADFDPPQNNQWSGTNGSQATNGSFDVHFWLLGKYLIKELFGFFWTVVHNSHQRSNIFQVNTLISPSTLKAADYFSQFNHSVVRHWCAKIFRIDNFNYYSPLNQNLPLKRLINAAVLTCTKCDLINGAQMKTAIIAPNSMKKKHQEASTRICLCT